MTRIAALLLSVLGLLAASPVASATHSQPPVDRGILKTLWKPIGFFKPGDAIPMPSAPPPADPNGLFNPSGHYSAYDTNVFETLNFPGRTAGDETNDDAPGSGDPRHGFCPPDPAFMPQGRCANHALEYLDFYERTMNDLLKDFGGTVHRYEFDNPGSPVDGGTPVGVPAGLSSRGGKTFNIAGVVPGADHPEQEVIVSGHWDFTDAAPAATWDSAEGHAEVVRMAKIMTDYWRATGTRPSATVKFMPWGAEESGTVGSLDYVTRHILEGEGARIRGYFNVDPCAGAYPAYYHGNPTERVPMVLQLTNPEEALEAERVTPFNDKAIKVIDEFYADIDDTVDTVAGPQPVFTDADRSELVLALGGLLAFNSDYANFEAIGVPIMNLFPDMFGAHDDGTQGSSEGVATIHTPRDNLQTLNLLTGPDQTGLTASDGWMKGMELCAHLESRYMLQPEMGGTQTADLDPVAYFEPLPWRANFPVGKLMTLDASGSYQYAQLATRQYTPDADLQFKWSFGDGTREAFGKTVKHAFKAAGTYPVTLTVTNRDTAKADTMTTNVLISEDNAGSDTDPGGQDGDPGLRAKNSVVACEASADTGFTALKVTPAGTGLKFEGGSRGASSGFLAEVFQVTRGRRAIKPKRLARFTVNGSFTWKPKGRLKAGTYFARMTARGSGARPDVRSVALQRTGTKFRTRKPFQRPDTCGDISLFRLDAPAFGPTRKLTAAFTLTRPGKATIEVLRGSKRVKRIKKTVKSANRLQKVAITPKKLRRGEYRIVLRAAGKKETLHAKRL